MRKKTGMKLMTALMAMVLTLGMCVTAFAATTPATTSATIDTSKTGSLTLYKYDYSAAKNDNVTGSYTSTGESNDEVESTYGSYAIAGVEFTALKVADIETYTTTSGGSAMVEVVYSLETTLATTLGLETDKAVEINSAYYWTSTQISEALAKKLSTDAETNVTTTTDALNSYVTTKNGTAKTTDGYGKANWEELALGLYLVVETKVPDQVNTTTDPFFVSIPMTASNSSDWNYDVTAYPKNQTDYPDITKKVRESSNSMGNYTDTVSSSIGDQLDYRIVSKLPEITSEATYLTQYTYKDTLSKGQTFGNESVVVSFYQSISDKTAASLGEAKVTLTKDTDYTVGTETDTNKDTVITIKLTAAGLEKVNEGASKSTSTNGNYSYMVISYTAELNEDAVLGDAGNENDVVLTYSRTNTEYTETLEDKTKVYTFGLDITKKFSGSSASTDASGVEFTLQNSEGKYITATEDSAESGKYTVTGLADTTESDNNTVFSPASDGSLYIAGLEADTYTLTETKTVSGYTLLKEPITIVITSKEETITASTVNYTSSEDGNTVTTDEKVVETADPEKSSAKVNGEDASMSVDATVSTSTNAAVKLEITNTAGFSMPTTGGAGIWVLTILGVLIGGLGIYIILSKKRQEN